jgi:predicted phage-related endonuclease
MSHHWDGGIIPDYVDVQARQNMAVLDAEWWDVVALIDSTTLVIQRIHRDRELEPVICEAVEAFWETHVVGGIPPEALTPEEARASLRARFPYRGKGKEPRRVPKEDGEHVEQAARWLEALGKEVDRLNALKSSLTDAFCEYVGEDYGIKDGWGSFLWYPVAGKVDWKSVAETLAGGTVPADVIEKHRGESTRIPKLYPFKPKGARRR